MAEYQIPVGLEYRRADLARISDMGGGLYRCDFVVPLSQPGEYLSQIGFGVRFTERPIVSNGYDMPANQQLVPGKYPVFSAGVHVWKAGRRPDNGVLFYDGATVALVFTGASLQQLNGHVTFVGKAVRNPAGLDNVQPS